MKKISSILLLALFIVPVVINAQSTTFGPGYREEPVQASDITRRRDELMARGAGLSAAEVRELSWLIKQNPYPVGTFPPADWYEGKNTSPTGVLPLTGYDETGYYVGSGGCCGPQGSGNWRPAGFEDWKPAVGTTASAPTTGASNPPAIPSTPATPTGNQTPTIQSLMEQVRQLQARIAQLEAQLNSSRPGDVSSAVPINSTVTDTSEPSSNNLYYGMVNDPRVRALQQTLKDKGFYNGLVNGNFYSQTYAAVQAYQRANGLPATGYVGDQTRGSLAGFLPAGPAIPVTPAGTPVPSTPSAPSTPSTPTTPASSDVATWPPRSIPRDNLVIGDLQGPTRVPAGSTQTYSSRFTWNMPPPTGYEESGFWRAQITLLDDSIDKILNTGSQPLIHTESRWFYGTYGKEIQTGPLDESPETIQFSFTFPDPTKEPLASVLKSKLRNYVEEEEEDGFGEAVSETGEGIVFRLADNGIAKEITNQIGTREVLLPFPSAKRFELCIWGGIGFTGRTAQGVAVVPPVEHVKCEVITLED